MIIVLKSRNSFACQKGQCSVRSALHITACLETSYISKRYPSSQPFVNELKTSINY